MGHRSFRHAWLASNLLALYLLQGSAWAGVLLQSFHDDIPSGGTTSWWNTLAARSHEFAAAGFTAVWLPSPLKGASGGYSLGYDPFDDYDLGSKYQRGTTATRFGTREQLQRMVAMMRSNGLDVYVDAVLNHRNGDPASDPYHFQYVDAYGRWPGGRFEKTACDFHPNVPQDSNVPDPAFDSTLPFGPDLAPVNGCNRHAWNGLVASGDWLTKALDIQGYRLDYVKGISTEFLRAWLSSGAMSSRFAVGEFYDGDLNAVRSWISAMYNRSSAFDFPLRFQLRDMCNGNGVYNMALLDHAGLAGALPYRAVTFVENHDTDVSDPIVRHKALAYALILTSEGYPCVYYKDYLPASEGGYGLKSVIDNLVFIHEKIAAGSTRERWKDTDVFVYERSGDASHPPLLTGLNDHPTNARTVTVSTLFAANTRLHDYTGHGLDVWTDANGRVTITVPANVHGGGYVCYSTEGIAGGFQRERRSVVQEFAGATDLDIRPADGTGTVIPARIWAMAGTPITGELYIDIKDWTDQTRVDLWLLNPEGVEVRRASVHRGSPQGILFTYPAITTGWYTWRIQSFQTPSGNAAPAYWLKAGYTATPFFSPVPSNALKVAGGLAAGTDEQAQAAGGAVDIAAAARFLRSLSGL